MRSTRITMAAGAAVILSLLLASATLASGPATRHRGTMTAVCGDQIVTVVVENGGQNVGAVQILDAFGHAILVSGTSTYTDTTVGLVLGIFSEGHGRGHAKQATTVCTTGQTATLADFYGSDSAAWPEGTAGTDTLVWTLEYVVILMD